MNERPIPNCVHGFVLGCCPDCYCALTGRLVRAEWEQDDLRAALRTAREALEGIVACFGVDSEGDETYWVGMGAGEQARAALAAIDRVLGEPK